MQIEDLLTKTCVIGLSYFDKEGELLKQSQYAGAVTQVDREQGISVQLRHSDAPVGPDNDKGKPAFIVPPNLDAWFKAPPGIYRHPPSGVDIENPDYLVTWSIYRTREETADGQHEWWEWVPNTEAPQVGR